MSDLQLDIFGNEIPINEIFKSDKKTTIGRKKDFREKHGYDHSVTCGTCKNFISCQLNTTIVYKCKKIGINSKSNTNISSMDIGCDLYEE